MDKVTSFIASLISAASTTGSVEVAPRSGLYIQSREDLISDQSFWDDDDASKGADFSAYAFWITTDDGADPVGFDRADDEDAIKILGQWMEDDE